MSIPFLVAMCQNAAFYSRPTANAWTGLWSAGTPTNAYDEVAPLTSVDTTTKTNGTTETIIFSAFQGTGTLTGSLKVSAFRGQDSVGTVPGGATTTTYAVSNDGGSTFTYATGSITQTTTLATVSITITGVNITQLQIQFVSSIVTGGSVKLATDYNEVGWVDISDIVLL